MNDKDENTYEDKILDCLMRNNYGLTVVGISKLIEASRNTVYRYLGILETKNLVFRKEIGRYNLYFSREGRQITIDVVAGFYKGLLIALNKELPIEPEQFKNIGRFISNYVFLPFEKDDIDQIVKIETPLKREFLDILEVIRPYVTLLHDKITLKDVVVNEEEKKLLIHFINSDILEEYKSTISHFYIVTGFIEEKIKNRIKIEVKCDVVDYQYSNEDEENFIKISLELI